MPSSVAKNGTTGAEVEQAAAVAATERQAENRSNEEEVTQQVNGVESSGAQEVNEEGVREETGNSDPEEESVSQPLRRRKFTKADNNSMDARYLSMFASSNRCLRMIWNEYFQNSRKRESISVNFDIFRTYRHRPNLDSATCISLDHYISATSRHSLLSYLRAKVVSHGED